MEHMGEEKVFTKPKSMYAMLLLGLFTFLFLGSEFLYVNRIALTAGEEKTVMVQNYALGVSAVGFFLYPLLQRFLKGRAQVVGLSVIVLAAAACNLLVQGGGSDWFTLGAGMVLFLLLGLLGSAIHYLFFRLAEERDYLARMVGISYAFGILLQFLSNNFVRSEAAEAVILSLASLAALALLLKAEQLCDRDTVEAEEPPHKENGKEYRKTIAAGGLLALLVILMACIFSTLDNAVTMRHVSGNDIGQWPRLLLAVSGVIAGFLFDIRKRKFMTTIMYCVLLMSVICVVVLKMGGSFLIGLIVFYLSSGFFFVFFTTGFLDFARHTRLPALWTGMGRAMNNVSAALLTNVSVALLVSDSHGMSAIILALVLFVAISVVLSLYTAWMPAASGASKAIPANPDPQEAFRMLSELFSLTPREVEVFDKLIHSEESIQEIADGLYLSRRTCQRYIASIYEKAGVKSRMGLYQLYIKTQLGQQPEKRDAEKEN